MYQQGKSLLAHVMGSQLFDAKPLLNPILTYCKKKPQYDQTISTDLMQSLSICIAFIQVTF